MRRWLFLRRLRRDSRRWQGQTRQTDTTFLWRYLGHVDPPLLADGTVERVFYLGPNHFPAGLYFPKGYNLEVRPADDDGWSVLRVRDCLSEQVLTMWAVGSNDGEFANQVRTLDGEQ